MKSPASDKHPRPLAQELGLVYALWRRDMLRLRGEPTRWIGVVLQPLLFWAIIGSGMGDSFQVAGVENLNYLQYFFPGILVMTVLFTAIFSTISVIEDRQLGFLQAVLVAPASRFSLVVGKILGVCSVAMLQCLLLALVAPFAGYSVDSVSWPSLFGVLLLTCIGLTGVTLSMAWVFSSTQAYHAIMSVLLIPLWVLSGSMFPRPDSWVTYVMNVNPMTYATDAVRSALAPSQAVALGIAGDVAVWVVLVFAVLAVTLAIRITRGAGGGND
ncbi:MAG: ABC transporter permease [Myxococcales bacterium]|nr:ABC transporter permease [Myxococcales bacterium]